MKYLALPTKPKKDNNQSDSGFYVKVFKWKENSKTVFVRRHNKEEGKNKLYSLFTVQCEPPLKTKLREGKGMINNITRNTMFNCWSSLRYLSVAWKDTYKELVP